MNVPASTWRCLVAAVRKIASVPDYDAYVAHLREHHPDRPIPTQAAFFAERQAARYRNGGPCC